MHEFMAALLSLVMGSLHGLVAVPSAKEAFNLWVVVIVMHRLNKFWMSDFKLLVVEFIRHSATIVSMQFSRWSLRLRDWLARFKVQLHVLSIDILVGVRIARHVARLVNDRMVVIESFQWSLKHSLRAYLLGVAHDLLTWCNRLNRGSQCTRMSIAILQRLFLLRSALIGLLGGISFLAVILISRYSRLELKRHWLGLGRLAFIHVLVIFSLARLAQYQVFKIILLLGNVEGEVQIVSEMLEVIKEPARMVTVWVMLQR